MSLARVAVVIVIVVAASAAEFLLTIQIQSCRRKACDFIPTRLPMIKNLKMNIEQRFMPHVFWAPPFSGSIQINIACHHLR